MEEHDSKPGVAVDRLGVRSVPPPPSPGQCPEPDYKSLYRQQHRRTEVLYYLLLRDHYTDMGSLLEALDKAEEELIVMENSKRGRDRYGV